VIPAIAVLALGAEPSAALVVSQVVLSMGIPFALIPLVILTSRRAVMGEYAIRSSGFICRKSSGKNGVCP
jgi:manganese transport protein